MKVPENAPDSGSSQIAGGQFHPTRWTIVLQAADSSAPEAQQALTQLCQTYWAPLYAFIRREGNHRDKAHDLTQSFFAHLLESDLMKKADPNKGKFRSFLLTSLKNFLKDEWRREKALRRGGAFQFVHIDAQEAEDTYLRLPADQPDSTLAYDRDWAVGVIRLVKAKLRQAYLDKGHSTLYDALLPYLTGYGERGFYAKVAEVLKIDENAVGVSLHRMRQKFGQLLRQEIAQTVASSADIDDEIKYLVAIWSQLQGTTTTQLGRATGSTDS